MGPKYSKVKWGPRRALLITATCLIVGQVVAAIIVALALALFGMASEEVEAWSQTTFGQFVFVVVAEALTLLVLWAFLRHRRPILPALGLSRWPKLKDPVYAFLGGIVYLGLLVAVTAAASAVFNVDVDQDQQIGFESVIGNADLILAFVSLVILPPIVEEVLFRGVFFGGLRTKLAFYPAVLFTSLLFAFPHLLQGAGSLFWIGAIDTFVLSLILCYLRERTGSLWASIMLHMLKNGVAYLFLFILAVK